MPTLTIDNLSVTVPKGTNVLEAAKQLGIVIPHFCYHEALGAVGACRLCAMNFKEGPVKGVQMSCMIEAQDGMVVSTVDADSQDLRRHVIEWLMMNHPHDCPVCDEGGECQLQDFTIAGGHSIRRYTGKKRAYNNQFLGPFIEHEMNRCIQCYRCVRTYQDYFGGDDFGVLGARNRIYYGRFQEGRLESPFSGNLVDVCPTGVFTNKVFRFKTRYWDIQEAPSICPHCSLGCATVPGARYRELQRVRAGINRQTNGFFICDRGRFGYGHANHPERPRQPLANGEPRSWHQALSAVRRRLGTFVAEHGADSVAFIGSARASLEANALLKKWAAALGCDQVVFESNPQRDRAMRLVTMLPAEQRSSLEEIRQADLLVLVGIDPLNQAPILAAAVRQAVRQCGKVIVLDPRPVDLPCDFEHIIARGEELPSLLAALASNSFEKLDQGRRSSLEGLGQRLTDAKRPVLIGGIDLLGEGGTQALLDVCSAWTAAERTCGAALIPAGPNSYGGALLAGNGLTCDDLLERLLAGKIKALICMESDPFSEHPDPGRAQVALSKADYLLVLDSLPTLAVRKAANLLPTRVTAESSGTFVNFEGRMLAFERAFDPGIPIKITGEGDHPPRTFETETPGGHPLPTWGILALLLGRSADLPALRRELAVADPRLQGLADIDADGEGVRVSGSGQAAATVPTASTAATPQPGALRILPAEDLFGTEFISSLSAPLNVVRPQPWVLLHPNDADTCGVAAGDAARLTTAYGQIKVEVRISTDMAAGCLVVPRLWGTCLENLVPGGCFDGRLEKGGAP